MVSFILQNILVVGLLGFLMVGLALSWKIKPMRYSLIVAIVVVISVAITVNYGGFKVEWLIAKSGYIALLSVWIMVLVIFVVGMYKLWKNYGKTGES